MERKLNRSWTSMSPALKQLHIVLKEPHNNNMYLWSLPNVWLNTTFHHNRITRHLWVNFIRHDASAAKPKNRNDMTKLDFYKSSRLIALRQETVTAYSTTSKLQKDASWRAAVSPRLEKKINQSLEHHYKSTFIAPTQNRRATRCSKYTLCWPPFHFNMAFPLKPTVVFLRWLHWCEGIPLWIISGSFHAFVFVCCFQRTAQAT